jgi:hypothetical protein
MSIVSLVIAPHIAVRPHFPMGQEQFHGKVIEAQTSNEVVAENTVHFDDVK